VKSVTLARSTPGPSGALLTLRRDAEGKRGI
jgi:hypothetical protein